MTLAFARALAGKTAPPATTDHDGERTPDPRTRLRTCARIVRERARRHVDAALDRLDELWDDEALADGWSGYCCFRHSADLPGISTLDVRH